MPVPPPLQQLPIRFVRLLRDHDLPKPRHAIALLHHKLKRLQSRASQALPCSWVIRREYLAAIATPHKLRFILFDKLVRRIRLIYLVPPRPPTQSSTSGIAHAGLANIDPGSGNSTDAFCNNVINFGPIIFNSLR